MGNLHIGPVESEGQIREIMDLQKSNVKQVLSHSEIRQEGFVTCQHNFELLRQMNVPHAHTVIVDDGKVVGYALVMLPEWRGKIKVLESMFLQMEQIRFRGKSLDEYNFLIMGQVCIAKSHRGQGLFKKMYQEYSERLSPHFDFCITEVDATNKRSLSAHLAEGWEMLHQYQPGDGHDWVMIIRDWSQ